MPRHSTHWLAALNLSYVAAGRFDAFWALSTQSWDVAAGVLLVTEAGGAVTDIPGNPFTLASSSCGDGESAAAGGVLSNAAASQIGVMPSQRRCTPRQVRAHL